MSKKLSLLLAAAAVLAFASPALAQGATGLTLGGNLIPTGQIITGTNVATTKIPSLKVKTAVYGTVTCAPGLVKVEDVLKSNSATTVKALVGILLYNAKCTTSSGAVAQVNRVNLEELHTAGGGSGSERLELEVELPGKVTCTYESAGAVSYNPLETTEGGNIVEIYERNLFIIQGTCGDAKLQGAFSLTTGETKTKVYLM